MEYIIVSNRDVNRAGPNAGRAVSGPKFLEPGRLGPIRAGPNNFLFCYQSGPDLSSNDQDRQFYCITVLVHCIGKFYVKKIRHLLYILNNLFRTSFINF